MNKLQVIQQGRKLSGINDTSEFQDKRMKFLGKLTCQNNPQDVEVFEMYSFECENGAIKSKPTIPQYLNEIQFCNTRRQIKTEITLEPKDNLGFDKAISILCDLCLELIKNNFHFAVFYAQGQRSPYCKMYDFKELEELDSYQRMKARLKFLRFLVPFRQHLFDTALLDDSHFVPLEFAPHWKYGSIFNLIFEYIPQTKEEKI